MDKIYGVVKPFGNKNEIIGIDRDYGFISTEIKDNVYFHKREIINQGIINSGDWVTFDIISNGNRSYATRVKPLVEEDDPKFIEKFIKKENWAIFCNDSSLLNVLMKYLQLNIDDEDIEKFTYKKIRQINNNVYRRKIIDKLLANNIFLPSTFAVFLEPKAYILKALENKHILETSRKNIFVKAFINAIKKSDEKTWSQVPKEIAFQQEIWQLVPQKHKIKLLGQKLDSNITDKEPYISELVSILKQNNLNVSSLAKKLPLNVLMLEDIFKILPNLVKVETLCLAVERETNKCDLQEQILNMFNKLTDIEKDQIITKIPSNLYSNNIIFKHLNHFKQIEIITANPNLLKEKWQYMGRNAKILLLYKMLKERMRNEVLLNIDKKDPVVSVLIILINNPSSFNFRKLHEMIQQEIIENAWNTNYEFKSNPLFPSCKNNKVEYCEGKFWGKKDYYFCPRTNNRCYEIRNNDTPILDLDYYIDGARVVADTNIPWKDWSLLEVIEILNIKPKIPGLSNPNEYVNRMAGWINRVIEIREVIKCTACGKIMISNKKYSKNFAVYNATVFNCQNEGQHDKSVYITHCWGCNKILDSRVSTIRDEDGFYICIHCGSGNKNSKYMQGDICPQCGETRMICCDGYKRYKCSNCSHEISLPPFHKITGTRDI